MLSSSSSLLLLLLLLSVNKHFQLKHFNTVWEITYRYFTICVYQHTVLLMYVSCVMWCIFQENRLFNEVTQTIRLADNKVTRPTFQVAPQCLHCYAQSTKVMGTPTQYLEQSKVPCYYMHALESVVFNFIQDVFKVVSSVCFYSVVVPQIEWRAHRWNITSLYNLSKYFFLQKTLVWITSPIKSLLRGNRLSYSVAGNDVNFRHIEYNDGSEQKLE